MFFFSYKQQSNEPIEEFATDLKRIALSCERGNLKDSLTFFHFLLHEDGMDIEQAVECCVTVKDSKKQSLSMAATWKILDIHMGHMKNQYE